MTTRLCRWGILSTALIAKKNWQSIKLAGNGVVAAVASRTEAKAQAFIDECQSQVPFVDVPTAYGSYDELIAAPDIDAVYIPLPTGLRKEWVIKAARAGKHVMCEKPCAIHADDLEEMIGACKENNVQFMDGIMYMHTQRLAAMRQTLDDGQSVGQLRRIASQFSFCAPEEFFTGNIRSSSQLEPAGCLGDLGWYTIRFTLWAAKYQMPEKVIGHLLNSIGEGPDSVPTEFSAELFFPGGISATFYNSFLTEHQQWGNLSGTKGNLSISDFVLPYAGNEMTYTVSNAVFDVKGCDMTMERHERPQFTREYGHPHETAQETNLFRNFSGLALGGQPDYFWSDLALKTQVILDACLASARKGGEPVEL